MRNLLLPATTLLIAFVLNAFVIPNPFLYVQASQLTASNVTNANTYTESVVSCSGDQVHPCLLDLGLIDSSFGVTNEATFLTYLNNNFSTAAERISEVLRITIGKKP